FANYDIYYFVISMQVWPLDIEMKFLEPFGRELHSMKKV
uniref:Uncharacterized protein n=1 Tax=Aegilops tauschii subsp. strangulata TaxID=200361 RepID=A0A453FNJ6_AEGTS